MKVEKQAKCTVSLDMCMLNENIIENINKEIIKKYKNKYLNDIECYFLELKKVLKMTNSISSAHSHVVFECDCLLNVLDASIGKWVNGSCQIAGGTGIFVNNDIIKVYIKNDTLESIGYSYDESSNSYVNNDKKFEDMTDVEVKIKNLSFIGDSYKYIGDDIKEI